MKPIDMEHHDREVNDTASTLIYGIRPVMEAIQSGRQIEKLFVQRELNNPLIKELKILLNTQNIPFSPVPVEKLNRITRKNHQGVVGFLGLIQYYHIADLVQNFFEKGTYPLVVLLDRVTDVRNFGAICRTAECMGADAVIIPEKGAALVNGDAMKASAGALNTIPVCREYNLKNTIGFLKDSGFYIAGCTEKAKKNIFEANFDQPVCLIFGSEEDGISPEYLKRCNDLLKITLAGSTLSLNVSVAAGMALYEVKRQRFNGNAL